MFGLFRLISVVISRSLHRHLLSNWEEVSFFIIIYTRVGVAAIIHFVTVEKNHPTDYNYVTRTKLTITHVQTKVL